MFHKILNSIVVVALVAAGAFAQSPFVAPTDVEIRQLLVQRIDTFHQGVGIVVGVIDAQGRRIVAYGSLNQNDPRPLDGNTMFEIGSVTKVFTSLLLSEMVQRGEVKLDDPVAKYLPSTVKVPERDGKQITLVDLATHTSGLPRMPSNFEPKNPKNPYQDYSVEQLYQFLSNYKLTRDPGSQYEYSNLGGGLLGFVLARRAGLDYSTLVQSWICQPLGMDSTAIGLTPEMKARFAVGHDAALAPADDWDLTPVFAGAGALRSSANDLLTFLAANLGLTKSPLARAIEAMLDVRRPTGTQGLEVALGWHILTTDGREIVWHNGGTGGFRSFIGFDRKARVGVVVLSNSETPEGVDDIGHHLLDPKFPLWQPPGEHKTVTLKAEDLQKFVGQYQLAPTFIITVRLTGDQLSEQATGQPAFPIFPESETEFFLKVVDAQISFVEGADGQVTGLVLHQNGREIPGKRISATVPAGPKEVPLAASVLAKYVGDYQLAPGFVITITITGDQLNAQATGQPSAPIFPESESEFFYKVVDAQISFVKNAMGDVTGLVLHQGGHDVPGKKIK